MIVSIGLRSTPHVIYYSITQEDDDQVELKVVDKLVLPIAMELPEQLKFLRNAMLDIVSEFLIQRACIKRAEFSGRGMPSTERLYIEAVLQELIASSTISKYYVGTIASISAKLGIERDEFKPLADGTSIFQEIDGWADFKVEERESILGSFSTLTL